MTTTIRFTVAPAAEHRGKWVAHMFRAPKIEGMPFGLFATKEQAIAAVAARKAKLQKPM